MALDRLDLSRDEKLKMLDTLLHALKPVAHHLQADQNRFNLQTP